MANAAKRFPGKALRGCKEWQKPCLTNTDKAGCYGRAIRELRKEGECPSETDHRKVKYPNSVAEAGHGRLKLLIKPTLGFRSMRAACATIKDFQAMRALRKKQASAFQLQPGIRGEVRLVGRAFGIGPENGRADATAWSGARTNRVPARILRKGVTRPNPQQLPRPTLQQSHHQRFSASKIFRWNAANAARALHGR